MLDAQLLYQSGREDPTCKCSPKDRCKFGVETTNTHIFKLKVGCKDGVGWSSAIHELPE